MAIPFSAIGGIRKIFLASLFFFGSDFAGKQLGLVQCLALGYLIDFYFYLVTMRGSLDATVLFALNGATADESAEGDN